ncbi:MAG: phage integrase SAM-like domain-containing protein [Burkholderiaceae bacterium]
MTDSAEQTTASVKKRHRSEPIPETIATVPGYPEKLIIYKQDASRFWQIRYYIGGKVVRRSSKTENKKEAYEAAKSFYNEMHKRVADGLGVGKKNSFESCSDAVLLDQKAKCGRGQLSEVTYKLNEYRLKKLVLPFFKEYEVPQVNYQVLQQFLAYLSNQEEELSVSTIKLYMNIVRNVMLFAERMQYIPVCPQFPKIAVEDNARGYFTPNEYYLLWKRAKKLRGKSFQVRKLTEEEAKTLGNDHSTTLITEVGQSKLGRYIKTVHMTEDLYQLIIFMKNSYIRPTDIKNMQHKHVTVVENEHRYLKLDLPKSKKHDKPITTMEKSVEVYLRLKAHHKAHNNADDYVFMPEQKKNRNHALKLLQRQFEILLWDTGLRYSKTGSERSLYSLRHTCIMFRLMFGDNIPKEQIADNARTSVDMINRFYGSYLENEVNVGKLQSRKIRK